MRKVARSKSRVRIRGKGWKKTTSIAAEKYETISRAIMASMTKTPMAFSDLVKRVEAKVGEFTGSIPWYTLSCLRELEARGRITRHRKPVLYSRR